VGCGGGGNQSSGQATDTAAVTTLSDSLAALNQAQKEIIRKFINKGDVSGFEHAGGLGSPIDNAINATKAAFSELQLLVASAG
jgi:hypothetical protein